MTRAAQLVAWMLMALAYPAYYSACVILVLKVIGAIFVDWWVIVGLGLYAPAAILFDIGVKIVTGPRADVEPGGRPGTEG